MGLRVKGTDVHIVLNVSLFEAVYKEKFKFTREYHVQCGDCMGQLGEIEDCRKCAGTGSIPHKDDLSITIPLGYRDCRLMEFKYEGLGNGGFNGGCPGDLWLSIRVVPDARFVTAGKDLVCEVFIEDLDALNPLPVLHPLDSPPYEAQTALLWLGMFRIEGAGGYQREEGGRGDLIYRLTCRVKGTEQNPIKVESHELDPSTTIVAFASELFPALDSLEKATMALSLPTDAAHREGIELILEMHRKVLMQHGIEVIPAAGEKFDPNWHEAVAIDSNSGAPRGHVTKVLQTGYRHGERLLRPARVLVSK